jgi:hypothetical protein
MDFETALVETVSKAEAKREVELHNLSFSDFIAEIGDKSEYKGSEVLYWLGY